jgi:hypothetical protein
VTQLSLFPRRGFALLLPWCVLAVDHRKDPRRPAVYTSRRRARYALSHHLAAYLRSGTEIVAVDVHEDGTHVILGSEKPARTQARFKRRR